MTTHDSESTSFLYPFIDAEERDSIFRETVDLAQDIDHAGRQLHLEFLVKCF